MNKDLITLEGYDIITAQFSDLKKEKEYWVEEKRIAAEQGDRSENAEYIAAKEKIRGIDKELYKLNFIIQNSRAVDVDKRERNDIVLFGSEVLVKLTEQSGVEKEFWIKLVGTRELVYLQKKYRDTILISNVSPIGRMILKKEVGDTFEFNDLTYEVLDIR